MNPEDWLEELRTALPGDLPAVTADERSALLDLARVAAHSSERWTAPISTFLVGIAFAAAAPPDRAAAVRALVERLEPPSGP